jgi:hypothetical protein
MMRFFAEFILRRFIDEGLRMTEKSAQDERRVFSFLWRGGDLDLDI